MGREQLPLEQRVIASYNRAAHRLQRAVDRGKAAEYDRGYVAGLGRAVFELTGQWPHEIRGCKPIRANVDGL
jgi:hypothetical protein